MSMSDYPPRQISDDGSTLYWGHRKKMYEKAKNDKDDVMIEKPKVPPEEKFKNQ